MSWLNVADFPVFGLSYVWEARSEPLSIYEVEVYVLWRRGRVAKGLRGGGGGGGEGGAGERSWNKRLERIKR